MKQHFKTVPDHLLHHHLRASVVWLNWRCCYCFSILFPMEVAFASNDRSYTLCSYSHKTLCSYNAILFCDNLLPTEGVEHSSKHNTTNNRVSLHCNLEKIKWIQTFRVKPHCNLRSTTIWTDAECTHFRRIKEYITSFN